MSNSRQATLRGIHYKSGDAIDVTVANGVIAEISPAPKDGAVPGTPPGSTGTKSLPFIAPGLVDLQINGYAGRDFNTFPLQRDTVSAAVRELAAEGVTSLFPTVTTNADERIAEAMAVIAKTCRDDAYTGAAVAGIHLEGPFISPEDGPRGAHPKEHVKPPDWERLQRWQEAADGRIRIVTCSPEWPEAPDFIRRCTEAGILVSIGHTAASPEQIRAAVESGARMSTHFGNGAHPMLPRHPNYLWEQLARDELAACLIADGFHLPESLLRVAMKVKGDNAVLVSDAVHLGGMPPGEYWSHRRVRVVKTPEGRLHMADNPGLLAGSAQTLPWGIAHLVRSGLCDLAQAWDRASVLPARLAGIPAAAGLAEGAPADLALFRMADGLIRFEAVYKHGMEVAP